MKKLFIVLLSVLLLTGCVEDPTSLNINGETQKEFSMNETAVLNDIHYNVVKVERSKNPATVNGNSFTKPSEGNEFILVTVKIENKSDEKITYYAGNWKMQNSLGQETEVKYTKNFDSGELLKDGIKEGIIVFEQPVNDNDLRLNFYYDTLFSSDYTFQIKINK